VLNEQIQLGDVFAGQTLNVVDADGATTAVTTATGNALSGAVESGSLTLTSTQTLQGSVNATTALTAAGSAGNPATILTQATGNTGDAGAYGASLAASVGQTAGAGTVRAATTIDASNAAIYGGATVGATALSNSQAFAVQGGALQANVTQSGAGITEAEIGASVRYIPGPATFSASAVANNLSSAGEDSVQTLTVGQSSTGARTQAAVFVAAGNAWNLTGAATATGANVSVSNAGASLDAAITQSNQSYVRAQSEVSAYDFGLGSAQAFAVGASSMAGNEGEMTLIDNLQTTSGGVEAVAAFTGHDGYDAYASATAIGNAATGYACADCGGAIEANNSQTNGSGVSATASVNVTGSNRATVGTANAVGNSATFYVTRPGS